MKMKAVMKNHDRESDFWYTQANKLFVCISKNGIDFTMAPILWYMVRPLLVLTVAKASRSGFLEVSLDIFYLLD